MVRDVGGRQPLGEEGGVFTVATTVAVGIRRRKPEGGGEGEIHFLEAAVGDVADGGAQARGQRWGEACFTAVLEPAERSRHDDFVEGAPVAEGGGDVDPGWLGDVIVAGGGFAGFDGNDLGG